MITAVYPGSFDPITMGHVDIVTRASSMFDQIVMAVVKNPGKQPRISIEDRLTLVGESVRHLGNVIVQAFEGLTVNLARAQNAKVIIRGLRAVSDFEYEFAMSQMNKHLCPQVETLFMMAGMEYQFLSSSMTHEVARLGGDTVGLVPSHVSEYLARQSFGAGVE